MRKILLATHGHFAEGILNSAQMILGELPEIRTLCAYLDPQEDFARIVEETVHRIPEGEELLVLTDLLGGSVNNEFMRYLNRPGLYVVTGLSLPLLLAAALSQEEDTSRMIQELLEQSRDAVCCCNWLEAQDTEDF